MSQQTSFFTLSYQKKLRCEKFLDEMESVMPWRTMIDAILPYYPQHAVGRPATDLLLLLKIYFLQQWYDLSDPGMEEAIYDRFSFQKFLGINLLADRVPDETTILNFRHLLEKYGLQKKFLKIVNDLLTQKGLLLKHQAYDHLLNTHFTSSNVSGIIERCATEDSQRMDCNLHVSLLSATSFVLEKYFSHTHDKGASCLHGRKRRHSTLSNHASMTAHQKNERNIITITQILSLSEVP